MKRLMFALLVGGIVFGTVLAVAASLEVRGGTIQAGSDVDLVCDEDGVDVLGWGYERDDQMVHFVRIGNIDADCQSNDMWVTITKDGAKIAVGGAHIDSTTEIIHLDSPVLAEDITDIHIAIEGDVDG